MSDQPTITQVKDMEKRIGVKQAGDLEQTIKDLRDTVRLQPKSSQKYLKMTPEDYERFGVEPSENL